MKYFILLLTVFGFSYARWYNLNEAINIAKVKKKPVLLYIYQENCDACKQMEMFTLSNKNVESIMDKFIVSSIDLDKNPYIKQKYGVFGTPTTIIINPYNQSPIFKIFGNEPANVFTKNLQYACKLSIKGGFRC